MENTTDITADALALQQRDEFRATGWLKLIAPAKVNLHLAIGARRADGYHEAATIMHAINLHDVVYARHRLDGGREPLVRMVQTGDVELPDIDPSDNIAAKAAHELAARIGRSDAPIELRIEKNIPAQGGLGGGSTDAAAALVAAAQLWGLDASDPAIEQSARALGADVAFFLHGGCSQHAGTGDEFVRALAPSKRSIALVKTERGVSTAAAYQTFDDAPEPVPAHVADAARTAQNAADVALFNNLASASERLNPELAEVRSWLDEQPGVEGALLCGSGSATFAVCDSFAIACQVVAAARKRGWWSRATSFGSARVMVVPSEGAR